MSDVRENPYQNAPNMPDWFRKERPVLLGELYFLEDDRCEVERTNGDAGVNLIVRLKEDKRDRSVGVIVRGDVRSSENNDDDASERISVPLSALNLPDSGRGRQPVIVLFFDMTDDEGYGQILPPDDIFSADANWDIVEFISLRKFQPSDLVGRVLLHSLEPEDDHVDLPSVAFLRGTTLNRRGTLLLSRDDHDAAQRAFEQALSVISRTEHPKLFALTLSNLAQVHHALGQLTQADALYDKALSIMADVEASSVEPRPSRRYSTLLGLS